MTQTQRYRQTIFSLFLVIGLIGLAGVLNKVSSAYRAQEIVRDACINASIAGKAAKDNGDENYGLAYWSLLIDELERAAKLDNKYFEVLEGAMVTRFSLAGNETMSGDFEMENFVKVAATCNMLTSEHS